MPNLAKNSGREHSDYYLSVIAFFETTNLTINKRTSLFYRQKATLRDVRIDISYERKI